MQPARRTRMLAGTFVLIAISWAVDMFTGGDPVKKAGASDAIALAPTARVIEPRDRADIDRFLFGDAGFATIDWTRADRRDPFAPDAAFEQLTANSRDAVTAKSSDGGVSASQPAAEQRPFESRHRFGGVVVGARKIALIDDRPFVVGDTIEEMRLVEVERDYIILEGSEGQLRLEVPRPAGE